MWHAHDRATGEQEGGGERKERRKERRESRWKVDPRGRLAGCGHRHVKHGAGVFVACVCTWWVTWPLFLSFLLAMLLVVILRLWKAERWISV